MNAHHLKIVDFKYIKIKNNIIYKKSLSACPVCKTENTILRVIE